MAARINSAEGGTNGTAVTTANSGGASGDPWESLYVPSGTSITFATAAAYKGTLGYRVAQGTRTTTGANLRRALTGWSRVRDRWYFRTSAYPTVASQVAYVTNAANTTALAKVILTTDGRLGVQNSAGATLYTGTPIALNTWMRVEWIVVPGTTATNGTIRFAWAVGDAAASGTFNSTSANTGTSGNLGKSYVGKLAGTWDAVTDFDDFAADDASSTTFLGVSVAGPTVVDPTPVEAGSLAAPSPDDLYREAIRSGVAIHYSVSASRDGGPVEGASDLRPVGGTVTDTTKPGVRRVLNLDLPPSPGLYDLLSPEGTTLTVIAHVRYPDRSVIDVPMGVFDVDTEKLSEGGGGLSLTAPDKWVRIQRAKFMRPKKSTRNIRVTVQITDLIREALGLSEPVTVTATSQATMRPLVWERDRDKAIIDLAESIGAWVYFDRYGVATIADVPQIGASADWLVDASASGVLIELDRERSRTSTRNVVVIESSAADGAKFATQFVWDNNPASPTYAGPGSGAGPTPPVATGTGFGLVPYFYDTPVLRNALEAILAGRTILARTTGLASQVSLGQVPNPAVDAFDAIDVMPPRERYDIARVLERHVVDTVTHPLSLGSAQQIEGRSTRTDAYVEGS